MVASKKVRYNFSISPETLEKLKQLARWDNRPVSNLLEWLILEEYEKLRKRRGPAN
jgi:hypothetical protein